MNNIGNYCIEEFTFDNNSIISISLKFINLLTSITFDIFSNNNSILSKIIIKQYETELDDIKDFIVNKINDSHNTISVDLTKYFKSLEYQNLHGIAVSILKLPIKINCIFTEPIDYTKSKYYCKGYLLYNNIITIFNTKKVIYNIGSNICEKCLLTKEKNGFLMKLNYDILNNIEINFENISNINNISIYIDKNLYFKVPLYLLVQNNKFFYDFNDFHIEKFKELTIMFEVNDEFESTNFTFNCIVYNIFNLTNSYFSRLR